METSEIMSIVAVLGTLTGALGGSALQHWFAGRRQRSAELRELTTALYVEIASYTQQVEALLDWLTDDWPFRGSAPGRPDGRPDPVLLTARAELLAPGDVQNAWADLLTAEEVLKWNVTEDGAHDPDGGLMASEKQDEVKAVRASIARVKSELKAVIGSG